MLSLSPRFDLFQIILPKDFIPNELNEKYRKILTKRSYPITDTIEYLSESIVSCSILGIDDITTTQQQTGINPRMTKAKTEPVSEVVFSKYNMAPLENLDRSINIEFRMNQGFYNYFLLYETIFHRYCKPELKCGIPQIYLYLLDSIGQKTVKYTFEDVYFQGIDELIFSYSQVSRQSDTFSLTLVYNDIKIEDTMSDNYDFVLKGSHLCSL